MDGLVIIARSVAIIRLVSLSSFCTNSFSTAAVRSAMSWSRMSASTHRAATANTPMMKTSTTASGAMKRALMRRGPRAWGAVLI